MTRRAWPIVRDYTMMAVGALVAALAVDFFLAPNNVVTGGYTGTARGVLLCVVGRAEISFLKAIVGQIAPHAFVIIGEATEVIGERFRPHPLPK